MGKYDHIVDKLPTLPGEEPSYQLKVDARKKQIVNEANQAGAVISSSMLAERYTAARLEKDSLDQDLYDLNVEIAAVSQMLVDQYEIDGISSLKLNTGERVAIQYEPYAVIEDREAFWNWCRANGYEREMQLHWKTMNGITKERLLQGLSEPEGVRAYTNVKTIFSRE